MNAGTKKEEESEKMSEVGAGGKCENWWSPELELLGRMPHGCVGYGTENY